MLTLKKKSQIGLKHKTSDLSKDLAWWKFLPSNKEEGVSKEVFPFHMPIMAICNALRLQSVNFLTLEDIENIPKDLTSSYQENKYG